MHCLCVQFVFPDGRGEGLHRVGFSLLHVYDCDSAIQTNPMDAIHPVEMIVYIGTRHPRTLAPV